MTTHMSNHLEAAALNLCLRNQSYTPGTPHLGLGTVSDDGTSVTELSGNGYARAPITFAAAASKAVANSAAVSLPAASGGSWASAASVLMWDAISGGNLLVYKPITPVVVDAGEVFFQDVGELSVTLSGAWSTYLANKFLDHVFRAQAWTAIGTVYAGLRVGTTEVSVGSYARVAAAFGAPVAGVCSNSGNLAFPTATDAWGTVDDAALYDAASAGNLMFNAALNAATTIGTGKKARFLAGQLTVALD